MLICWSFNSCRVRWLREIGIIKRDENRWVPQKPKYDGVAGFLSVGFAEIKPAIQMLLHWIRNWNWAIANRLMLSEPFFAFY